jgi:hypothetical protein
MAGQFNGLGPPDITANLDSGKQQGLYRLHHMGSTEINLKTLTNELFYWTEASICH